MNIKDLWPEKEVVPLNTTSSWHELFCMRYETFSGFCEVESEKGFLKTPTPLATTYGQEMARILMFRAIEETVEALSSVDQAHVKEEYIDALNYVWSILCLDPTVSWMDQHFLSEFQIMWDTPVEFPLPPLSWISWNLAQVCDLFRNRSWMNRSQDVYFNGAQELRTAILDCTRMILQNFEGWEDFWQFYVAKNRVLQFRLRSGY